MVMSPRARWAAVAALYAAITLAYARTLLPDLGSALPNDAIDPGLNTWILWWNAQAVPLTERWWNAPIFFPAKGTFALSETFLHLWPLSTPMQWAGASAVLTYNVMFLLAFPAAALGAHLLAWRLTGRHSAALVAGLAYGFAPYRAAQIPHMQTLWSCWMPIALFALHRYLDGHKRRDLVLFSAAFVMNALATGYYLVFFSILLVFWIAWFVRNWRDMTAIGLALAASGAVLLPWLLGYRHYQSAFGVSRGLEEIRFFSADLIAVWMTNPYVLSRYWTLDAFPERELYPGAMVLTLIIAAFAVAWWRLWPERRSRLQPWIAGLAAIAVALAFYARHPGGATFNVLGMPLSMTRPARNFQIAGLLTLLALSWEPRVREIWRRRSPLAFYLLAAVLMFAFALGPDVRLLGNLLVPTAPYAWLMELPGGLALRVPARFAMLWALCLAIAAAIAFKRLTPRGAPVAVAAIVAGVVTFEGFVDNMGTVPAPRALALAGREQGRTLLEITAFDEAADAAAMVHATQGNFGLVNGFSGYWPPHYFALRDGIKRADPSIVEVLREYGTFDVYVSHELDPENRYRDLMVGQPGVERVMLAPQGTLFRVPRRAPDPSPLAPVKIASLATNNEPNNARFMLDGDLNTVWQTPFKQNHGDEVTITLEQPVAVARVEMDLGRQVFDYPRKLRVSVVGVDGQPVVVWEGGTMGAVMRAALTDRLRQPVSLHLPKHVVGRKVVLTLLEGYDENSWSIAEIRVLGLK